MIYQNIIFIGCKDIRLKPIKLEIIETLRDLKNETLWFFLKFFCFDYNYQPMNMHKFERFI